MNTERHLAVRQAAMDFLASMQRLHGDTLHQDILRRGFDYDGRRVPMMNPQGIFKPAILDMPLTFRTAPHSLRHPAPSSPHH
jgi:putative restriction endonuclease